MNKAQVLDIIDLCYRGLEDPAVFEELTRSLCAIVRADAGDIVIEDLRSGNVHALGSHGFDESFRSKYDTEHFGRNPWFENLVQHGTDRFHTDEIEPPEFWQSAYYNEWVRPQGLHRTIGAAIEARSDLHIWAGFARTSGSGSFEPQVAELNLILPHLRRSIKLHERYRRHHADKARLRGFLDAVSVPILILDAKGRVRQMNCACDTFLTEFKELVISRSGRLMAVDGRTDARLGSAIHWAMRALDYPEKSPQVPIIVGRATSQKTALHVLPLRNTDNSSDSVIVAILPLCADRQLDITAFARGYDLTPTEAALAEALGKGREVSDFAAERGISIGTARWHLKNLERKSGITRLPELVAAISASSSILR